MVGDESLFLLMSPQLWVLAALLCLYVSYALPPYSLEHTRLAHNLEIRHKPEDDSIWASINEDYIPIIQNGKKYYCHIPPKIERAPSNATMPSPAEVKKVLQPLSGKCLQRVSTRLEEGADRRMKVGGRGQHV